MRSLNPDEADLWAKVTATIRPLSRERIDPETPETQTESPQVRVASSVAASALRKAVVPVQIRPGTTLDGSWDKRLSSGSVNPDRTLDLHGMNLDTAWRAIDRALEQAIRSGERVLLLITGHQRSGEPPVERGRIRAAVHDWLAASRHARDIAAVRGAHRRHGGGGSLYIVLRRR